MATRGTQTSGKAHSHQVRPGREAPLAVAGPRAQRSGPHQRARPVTAREVRIDWSKRCWRQVCLASPWPSKSAWRLSRAVPAWCDSKPRRRIRPTGKPEPPAIRQAEPRTRFRYMLSVYYSHTHLSLNCTKSFTVLFDIFPQFLRPAVLSVA